MAMVQVVMPFHAMQTAMHIQARRQVRSATPPRWKPQADLFTRDWAYPKPRSISIRTPLSQAEKAFRSEALRIVQSVPRPVTREDCRGGIRPCPFSSCEAHLKLEISKDGTLRDNFPGVELEDMPATCWLDIAEEGEHTFAEVGVMLNVTEERIRQIFHQATRKSPALREAFEKVLDAEDIEGRGPIRKRTGL